VITDDELADLLGLGHEQPSVEFMGSESYDDRAFFAKVTRACLGMSNHRDGGLVIIGVNDKEPLKSPGLSADGVPKWLNYDQLMDGLGRYADPTIRLDCASRTAPNNAVVVVLEVYEFEEVPTLCKKDFQGVLTKGSLYVRRRGKPETTSHPSLEEMRELLTLAIDKLVRGFIERATRVGLALVEQPSAAQQFDAQLGDLT
jgi:predicted HTH transcriptional regulator